jgi:hypothetical protein
VTSRLVVPVAVAIMTGVVCWSPLPAPLAAKAALGGRTWAVEIAQRSFTMSFLSYGSHTGELGLASVLPAYSGATPTSDRLLSVAMEPYLGQGTKSSFICRSSSQWTEGTTACGTHRIG